RDATRTNSAPGVQTTGKNDRRGGNEPIHALRVQQFEVARRYEAAAPATRPKLPKGLPRAWGTGDPRSPAVPATDAVLIDAPMRGLRCAAKLALVQLGGAALKIASFGV